MTAAPVDGRRELAAQEAASWALRLESEQLSAAERGQFVDWLRESPVHVAEMLRIGAVQSALADFGGWQHLAPVDAAATNPVVAFPLQGERMRTASRPAARPYGKYLGLLAASVAFIAIAVGFWVNGGQDSIQTLRNEHREIKLADGSLMEVAPDSKLRLRLGRNERLVMLDRGQVLFHVAKDPSRPFVVRAGRTQVQAVGTAFSVDRSVGAVVVTVAEGRVTVSLADGGLQRAATGAAAANLSLGIDEQVAIASDGTAGAVRAVNSQTELAWARGLLIFNDDPVAEVVQRFNLSNRMQIVIVDQELAARRLSGVFDASDPQSFVEFLKNAADVTVAQDSPEEIVVSRPSAATPRERMPAASTR